MVHAMEFQGQLRRADGRPAEPGTYDLAFGLHGDPDASRALWDEVVRGVAVDEDGGFRTVLGAGNALRAEHFDGSPRFLSVRIVRGGRREAELSGRVPVLGVVVQLGEEVRALAERLDAAERARDRATRTARRVRALRRRILSMESGEGPIGALHARIGSLEARLARLEGPEGRLTRLEDELEDIVGPDGDLVDLSERIAAIETSGRRDRAPG